MPRNAIALAEREGDPQNLQEFGLQVNFLWLYYKINLSHVSCIFEH
jgi:hypothetical protein